MGNADVASCNWSALRRALQCVDQHDAANLDQINSALHDAAPLLLAQLLPPTRNAAELAQLKDPGFEHRGHRLEPLGRQLVLALSHDLNVSEMLCWELIHRTAQTAPCVSGSELRGLASTTYYWERSTLLSFALDVSMLASTASSSKNSCACAAARAFINHVNTLAASNASAYGGASLLELLTALCAALLEKASGGPLGCTFDAMQGHNSAAAAAPLPVTTPATTPAPRSDTVTNISDELHRELRLTCLCIFHVCIYAEQCERASPMESTIILLIKVLERASALAITKVSDLLLLSLVTLFSPRPMPSTDSSQDTSRPPASVAVLEKVLPTLREWLHTVAQPMAANAMVAGLAPPSVNAPQVSSTRNPGGNPAARTMFPANAMSIGEGCASCLNIAACCAIPAVATDHTGTSQIPFSATSRGELDPTQVLRAMKTLSQAR